MNLGLLAAAAVLLSIERVGYVWIARAPRSFRRWCARPSVAWLGEPVDVVRALFLAFKAVQCTVFAVWWWVYAGGWVLPAGGGPALAAGGALMVVGQTLNVLVFYRLGRIAVFFGERLGHDVTWCEAFPFSVLAHPQYVGSVMTIWGFFLAVRFPHDDWCLLPVLETAYYVVGAWIEGSDASAGAEPHEDSAPALDGASARRG